MDMTGKIVEFAFILTSYLSIFFTELFLYLVPPTLLLLLLLCLLHSVLDILSFLQPLRDGLRPTGRKDKK